MDTLYEKYMLQNPASSTSKAQFYKNCPFAGDTDPVDTTEAMPLSKAREYGFAPYGDQIITQIT